MLQPPDELNALKEEQSPLKHLAWALFFLLISLASLNAMIDEGVLDITKYHFNYRSDAFEVLSFILCFWGFVYKSKQAYRTFKS